MHASKRSVVLSLAPLLCALSAFPRSGAGSIEHANQPSEGTIPLVREKQILAAPTFDFAEHDATPAPRDGPSSASERLPQPDVSPENSCQ
jgi:hypothetical protein